MLRHPPEWEEEVNFQLQWCDLEHLPGMMILMLEQERLGVLHSCPFDFFPHAVQ